MSDNTLSKTCTSCNESFPTSNFHKKKGGKYGVRPQCKCCVSKSRKTYTKEYYHANKDMILRKQKINREQNHEQRRKIEKT